MTGMHATITKTKCSSCYIDSESDVTVMLMPMTSQISVGKKTCKRVTSWNFDVTGWEESVG